MPSREDTKRSVCGAFGAASRSRRPASAFFSFSPGNRLRRKKRAEAHAAAPAIRPAGPGENLKPPGPHPFQDGGIERAIEAHTLRGGCLGAVMPQGKCHP